MTALGVLLVGLVLLDHLVLAQRFDRARSGDQAQRMRRIVVLALASAFVLTASLPLSHLVQSWVAGEASMRWAAPIAHAVIAVLATRVSISLLGRRLRSLEVPLRALRPLVAINAVVLGIALLELGTMQDPLDAILHASLAGLGFVLAAPMFAAMIARLDDADVPPILRGAPIAVVNAALMALAVAGLASLFER